MNTMQLIKCIQQDVKARRIFKGVYPHDWLPLALEKIKQDRNPSLVFVNTSDSSGTGEHWVSLWVSKTGHVEYFCSFGLPPPHPNIHNILFQCSPAAKVVYNHRSIQHVSSIACGLYVLYYAIMKARGYSMRQLLSPFSSVHQWQNDRIVRRKVIHLLRKARVYEPMRIGL